MNMATGMSPNRPLNWKALLRPPADCRCQEPVVMSNITNISSFSLFESNSKGKQDECLCLPSQAAQELSNFVDFLVDMGLLDNLQQVMEEAIQKVGEVMEEEDIFLDFKGVSSSSESDSTTCSCETECDHFSSGHYTSNWTECPRSKARHKPGNKAKLQNQCLLDKFIARIPSVESKRRIEDLAESITEKSTDYYSRQEHFHIWAHLAESLNSLHDQAAVSDFSSHDKTQATFHLEEEFTFSTKNIEKEVTNVLKKPTPSDKLYPAFQDIINQAVLEVQNATNEDGSPSFNSSEDSRCLGKSQQHRESLDITSVPRKAALRTNNYASTQTDSEQAEERVSNSITQEEAAEEAPRPSRKSRARLSQKPKLKPPIEAPPPKPKYVLPPLPKTKPKPPVEAPAPVPKPKYVPPPLPKSKPKPPIEAPTPVSKPKYVPPPLPKTKPRPPPEKLPPKPKYMPPPLPKPKQKKPEKVKEEYPQDQPFASHLQRSIIETAAKRVLCKYNYEKSLSEKLGFISVPVTKVLLEIMFGFKNLKGSNIKISSQINWAEVYQQIQTKCSSKSQKPRAKRSDKKSPPKPAMMRGKAEFSRKTPKKNITSLPEIIELVPLHFPEDLPQTGEDSQQQDSVELFREISSSAKSSIVLDSQRKLSVALFSTEDPSSVEVVKQSSLSQRVSITSGSVRKSSTVLLHTEENSVDHLEQAPSSRRTSTVAGSSRRSSAVLLGTASQNCVELLRQFSSSPRTSIASRSASKSSVVPLDTEGNSVESLRQPSLSERAITGESSPKSSTSLPKI